MEMNFSCDVLGNYLIIIYS